MKTNRLFSSLCAWSFFFIIFFNSFVDLGHKIIIQNIFYDTLSPRRFTIMSAVVNALVLIPYIVMFSPSGFLADRFGKVRVMQVTAWLAVPMTLMITYFYYHGQFWPAFSMTLLLGFQSVFNSPAKYGYVKEYFSKEYITKANAFVQSITMVAILAGTFLFSVWYGHFSGALAHKTEASILLAIAPAGWILVGGSLLEAILTSFLVSYPASAPNTSFKISRYITGRYLWENVKFISVNRTIFYCIIALSIFWGVNQVVIAVYGAYLKEVDQVSVVFVQGCFAIATIGVLLGAISATRISKRFIETGSIPFAILALAILLFVLVHVKALWLVMALFLVYGYFSGLLVVPLNALIQFNAPDNALGKILAGNNFLQFLTMFLFLMLTIVFSLFNMSSVNLFYIMVAVMALGAVLALRMLPQAFIRFVVWWLFSRLYRLEVKGLNHLPSSGGVLLLGNHVSYLDWAVLALASPRSVRFVMDRGIYEQKLIKWLLKASRVIPISRAGSKSAISAVQEALKKGDVVALFPEGYVSRNGQLGEFFRGFEMAVQETNAVIVPFYIDGMWGSATSQSSARYRNISKTQLMRTVTLGFGAPLPTHTKAAEVKQAVVELSSDIWREAVKPKDTLAKTWFYRMCQQGSQTVLVDHLSNTKLSGYRLLAAVWYFKKLLKPTLQGQDSVGILLPNSLGGVIANLACLCLGKKLINVNFTANPAAIQHMLDSAGIKTVISSEQFLKKLALRGITLSALSSVNVVHMETLKASVKPWKMGLSLAYIHVLPKRVLRSLLVPRGKSSDTAAILFSSGSEGLPKGVELSHYNMLSNIRQVACVLNVQERDVVLSCLPMFHAFGLVVTTFMPLLSGTKIICVSDPMDAAQVAKAIATYEASILCGTSTFLNFYVRSKKAHPLMFKSLRLVISGAEKLSSTVRQGFHEKFLLDVYEGYGATETSPVASFNLPDILVKGDWHVQVGHKVGTVGLPLPGTLIRIVDPVTKATLPFGEAGLIFISGPQVMTGYLNQPEKTAAALIELDGHCWYNTGDKGYLDEDGFLTIVDRYSRFAKIAGEMVSLGAIEQTLRPLLPQEADCLAVNIPDERKGEQVILLVSYQSNV